MAKQTFGIGGPWTGQIGKTYVGLRVVNGHAIRKYIVPPNPQTAPQVAQRGKFGLAGRLASLLKDSIIKDLWNPFAVNVYGVNNFTGANTKALTTDTDFPNVITAKGGYEPLSVTDNATYDDVGGNLVSIWNTTTTSVGQADDKVYLVIVDANDYDPLTDKFNLIVYVLSNKVRSDGVAGYTQAVGAGKLPAKFHTYLACRNPITESKLKVAVSKYMDVVAS